MHVADKVGGTFRDCLFRACFLGDTMNRTQTRLVAFGLILLLGAPSQADAGLFGWLKRRKTKCRPAPVCPAPSVSAASGAVAMRAAEPPQFQIYQTYCHVILFGQRWDEATSQWVQCYAIGTSDLDDPSDWNCMAMIDQAYQRAAADLHPDCVVDNPQSYCEDGSCPDYVPEYVAKEQADAPKKAAAPAVASSECVYKVTYQICCGGKLIDRPICHPDLEVAKFRAKVLACFIANNSDCCIRWCKWKICRVPASQCK